MELNYKYGIVSNLWWLPLVLFSPFKTTTLLTIFFIIAFILIFFLIWQIHRKYPAYNPKFYTNSVLGWGCFGVAILITIIVFTISHNLTLLLLFLMLSCMVRDSFATKK